MFLNVKTFSDRNFGDILVTAIFQLSFGNILFEAIRVVNILLTRNTVFRILIQ